MGDDAQTGQGIFIVQVTGPIAWRLTDDDPHEVLLPFLPGWSLLSPMAYETVFGGLHLLLRRGNEFLIERHDLALRQQEGSGSTNDAISAAEKLLGILRFISRQQGIPRMVSASWEQPLGGPPVYSEFKETKAFVRDYMLHCALTGEHLKQLQTFPDDFEIAVHVDVLLDALHAQLENDWRRTILYSAIAMESLASTVLERAYENAKANPNSTHRVLTIQVGGGQTRQKDPVYDLLAKSDNFGQLLHERPLYLLGKSLLDENAPLYQRAKSVYTTRNKIVHRGVQPDDANHLPLTQEGALEAIRTATEVFAWFGEPGGFVPFETLVPVIPVEDGK